MKSNYFKHKEAGTPNKRAIQLTEMFTFWHGIQKWIRQEIVDDDPYDEETLFPVLKQGDVY